MTTGNGVAVRDEPEIVRAVLATLTRIVAEDDARLAVRSYDPQRRCLALVLSDRANGDRANGDRVTGGPDAALIREFLVEVLCSHGIWLDELVIDTFDQPATEGDGSA